MEKGTVSTFSTVSTHLSVTDALKLSHFENE